MALDRTKTIKRRKLDIYLPTMEDRNRWKAAARLRGLSTSRWVYEVVERHLAGPTAPPSQPGQPGGGKNAP